VLRVEAEMEESVVVFAGDQYDVAATAAIPAVGAAPRHELLAVEADKAMPTVSGPNVDFRSINQGISFRLGEYS